MVCIWKNEDFFLNKIYILGDVREKLRLAFDMYDMNKNGKVIKSFLNLLNITYACVEYISNESINRSYYVM